MQPLLKTWFIVSQVKSHRVVYFTDDPGYTPPTEGDWYYVSPYQGELPQAMSLRNCWGYLAAGDHRKIWTALLDVPPKKKHSDPFEERANDFANVIAEKLKAENLTP